MKSRIVIVLAMLMPIICESATPDFASVKVIYEGGEMAVSATAAPKAITLKGDPSAAKYSERNNRKATKYQAVKSGDLAAAITCIPGFGKKYTTWRLDLKNGGKNDVQVKSIEFFRDWSPTTAADGERVGMTDGAVAIFPSAHIYVGVENPLTKLTVSEGKATAVLPRECAIHAGETWRFTWVAGEYTDGQLRRDFNYYLNRERAHPYRVLPHYNSWYDININRNDLPWEKRMNEAEALGVMVAFREALSKRGVFIDSYLWDDGWDNWDSLWDFHPGFPNGFTKLADEAHKNKGASIGCWMSPCGGYGGSCSRRVKFARDKGYIGQNEGLLRLSSPTYYAAFRDRVIKMIKDYDMNLFKFDRMGVGHDCEGAAASHVPDLEGVVRLIGEMRAAKQDVFVNATVGTWASPFWVMYADSIWRGGNDFETAGVGTKRQQWLTYRDNVIHDRFVVRSPLFPLNSMMMHGIIVNRGGPPTCMDISDSEISTRDFLDEVWMGVACGTGLQEYYITPKLMHEKWWDGLADGVKWLKANQKVLVDVHWVGGDPWTDSNVGEIYGYASWGKGSKGSKGIVILRNPSDKPQVMETSLAKLLELPKKNVKDAVKKVKIVHTHGLEMPSIKAADDTVKFAFEPFGIVLFEVSM